jgi:hypothetical protein
MIETCVENMASDEHQILVKKLIDHFESKRLTIQCAAYGGYDECPKYGRHEPDVVAMDSSGLLYIGEAETCGSLSDEDTRRQFVDFSNRAMANDKRKIPFYIAIPTTCENGLLQILDDLGVRSRDNIRYVTF